VLPKPRSFSTPMFGRVFFAPLPGANQPTPSTKVTLYAEGIGAHNHVGMIDGNVFAVLLDQVEAAKRIHKEAKQRYWDVVKPRPRGIPPPDGELIRRIIADENRALNAYLEATMRLNRYLLDGTIPDDLTR
jgi:hypothetical protein